MPIVIAFSDPDCAIATLDNVVVTVLRKPFKLEHTQALRRALAAVDAQFDSTQRMGMTIIESAAISVNMDKTARKAMEALVTEFPTTGSGVVIEATGLIASAGRAVITGMTMLSNKNKIRVFSDSNSCTTWLASLPAGRSLTAEKIQSVVDAARAAH